MPIYFFTDQAPNYTIKGCRDLLGFQKIWQDTGKKLIHHLSTVTSNIKDFQVFCAAYSLKKQWKMVGDAFEAFFIRFEYEVSIYDRLKQTDIPMAITHRLKSMLDVHEFGSDN